MRDVDFMRLSEIIETVDWTFELLHYLKYKNGSNWIMLHQSGKVVINSMPLPLTWYQGYLLRRHYNAIVYRKVLKAMHDIF